MAKPSSTVVRILADTNVDGKIYRPNQVVQFDAKVAKDLVNSGAVDDNADAVDYAQNTLGAKLQVHQDPVAANDGSQGQGGNETPATEADARARAAALRQQADAASDEAEKAQLRAQADEMDALADQLKAAAK